MVLELKTRVGEMKLESAYQLRLCNQKHEEKLKEVTENFVKEIEAHQEKIEVSW